MKHIEHPKRRLKSLTLALLGVLCSTTVLFAKEANALFADFQSSAVAADPKLAEEAMMRQHPKPPTEQEIQKFIETRGLAAVSAMDCKEELEKQYPQSKYLPEVRSKLAETLGNSFGI